MSGNPIGTSALLVLLLLGTLQDCATGLVGSVRAVLFPVALPLRKIASVAVRAELPGQFRAFRKARLPP
jgi:hypothetical protein